MEEHGGLPRSTWGATEEHGKLRRSMTSFRRARRAAEDPSQPRTGTRAAPAERAEGAGRARTTPAQSCSDRSIDLPRRSAMSSDRSISPGAQLGSSDQLIHCTCVCAVRSIIVIECKDCKFQCYSMNSLPMVCLK
jgi:hypothetical protein